MQTQITMQDNYLIELPLLLLPAAPSPTALRLMTVLLRVLDLLFHLVDLARQTLHLLLVTTASTGSNVDITIIAAIITIGTIAFVVALLGR